jgi:uncharacterized membrane protein
MNNDTPPFGQGQGRGFFMRVPGNFDGGGHHGGPGALGWVIFALQLLMLVALTVLLVRAFRFAGPPPGRFVMHRRGPRDPLAHVRMRYARGDISREEYLQTTRDLGGEPEEAPTPGT